MTAPAQPAPAADPHRMPPDLRTTAYAYGPAEKASATMEIFRHVGLALGCIALASMAQEEGDHAEAARQMAKANHHAERSEQLEKAL